ncbi:SDR family oxidoreductase [Tessaracoccus rhinocerotis]|uniref:SDR family oxidoreductase n=1 Tax=Tessaracoccus rhinocerotis TaxID=1689449 RepID=A0A553K0Y4_9ACTN|nr:NAD-dependent epimerase/dehydratase family protein [Tessaracoccus rhinocerotis]TRY18364.1 SDR family oxidoreductase [Tessaracoccus rhinocerotis]
MTGRGGFLGWHTRAALRETGTDTTAIAVGEQFEAETAVGALNGATRLIHIAGVNRATPDQVSAGNIQFAEQVSEALRRAPEPPPVVVYANSTQTGNGTPYGEAKARAGEILALASQEVGAQFLDLRLPNLFGEHGRPFYNAVTATFCHILSTGGEPRVDQDKELTLLHAQNAADLLTGATTPEEQGNLEVTKSVSGLLGRLRELASVYDRGEMPDLADEFDRDLFNTYRSYTIETRTPITLTRHADPRGSFFEVVRSHGGTGQSAFSTTVPGISRGDHFHRRKVERFTVLAGQAVISLRKLFTDEVLNFTVAGDAPVAVDMPTMWAHRITNTGTADLFTSFWTNDLFDPSKPDTISEVV